MLARARLMPALAAVLGLALAGCREELGPERLPTTTVRGVVVAGPSPVAGGWIEFLPVEGTPGNPRVARLAGDGTFVAEKVPVGRVLIRFERLDLRGARIAPGVVDPALFRTYNSPVRRTIPAVPGPPVRIDLFEESIRAAGRRRAGRRRKRSGQGGSAGTAPDGGSEPPSGGVEPTIRIIYRDGAGTIHLDWPTAKVAQAVADAGGTAWIDIEGLDSGCAVHVEAMLRDVFRFHPLAIEDALKDTHVPRVDDWGQYLYLVAGTIDFDPEDDSLRLHELDIFLGPNYLVTYHNEPAPVLDRQRQNIEREPDGRLRHGVSHLLYRLLDVIVDDFLFAMEHLDTAIDDIQDEIFDDPDSSTLQKIQEIKRGALRVQRILLPFREAINRLARDTYAVIPGENRVYFRDVYDHLVRIHDIAENLRDLISGALDTYLSVVSNRTNDVMKALTLVTVMFLPMTFLVGFFGMNFFGQTLEFTSPPLPRAMLFWGTMAIMLATPFGIALIARRRGWF
ncbi:magnesium/cobalt transporter CorA [Tundrisphaera sp. TA3]|uniref:magnesium/cobalt transporter CorA n=1 Tax=Tundrisphaera sp. TA3 TaxID=3435775 RepID=UPI003EB69587